MKKLLFVTCILNSCYCFAESIVNISYQYYNFTPLNNEGLHDAAFKATPIMENGKKFLGYTNWSTRWHYTYNTNQLGCFITSLTVNTDIKITLPKLTSSNDSKKYIVFNSFLEKLKYHEHNHAKIASQYSKNLDVALKKLPPQKSCEQLKSNIDKIGYQFVADTQRANGEYDKETNHGATEGAVLANN